MTKVKEAKIGSADNSIRPFEVKSFSEEDLVDLRQRIEATRWPEKETVEDGTQGVQLKLMKAVAKYWATDYDWGSVKQRSRLCRISSPRSMDSTFISFTLVQSTKMLCRSSSLTVGPAHP